MNIRRLLALILGVCVLPASAAAAGGGTVTVGAGGVSLDGFVDSAYRLLDEDTFSSPDLGISGQTTTSDAVGESSANLVWFDYGNANYLGFDAGAGLFVRGSGSADIQRIWVTWDATYIYLAVEGPNAYHEGFGVAGEDDMDLFIAVDTQDSASSLTTPTLASAAVPGSKAVDFAGWAPNYFIVVRAIGLTWQSASLYEGLVEQATDSDLLDHSTGFEADGRHDTGLTELRIAWALIGGRPPAATGLPWNLAVYTTYSDDSYDTYDSAPGLGQGTSFEQLGDTACDSDYCGGTVDPVTGALDACDCVNENDSDLGAGLSPTGTESPGSDHTGVITGVKDIDTIQGYFRVTNVGQLPDSDGDGIYDLWEDVNGDGILDNDDSDLDGIWDYLDDDDDGDGILTSLEDANGNGDPRDDDANGDGIADYLQGDADGDGLDDGLEDLNLDGVWDASETNPYDSDSDGDGLDDGVEDSDGDGVWDATETDPRNPDTDGDGTWDGVDLCPLDAAKIAPGVCGCGVSEADGDGDGTPDCTDGCPSDATKIAPGFCGCGVSEVDSDSDGTPDCTDGCPDDAAKTAPGLCGCGEADVDTDGDGTADCDDGCPDDASKLAAGACGCGVADTDSDVDGEPDCSDGCPTDADKTEPGTCGCGVVDSDTDTDGDGTADCVDECVDDADKTLAGACGCGVVEATPCPDATDPASVPDKGCNCRTGGSGSSAPWFIGLLLGLLFGQRRRRRAKVI